MGSSERAHQLPKLTELENGKPSFDLEPSSPKPRACSSPRSFYPAEVRGDEQGMLTSAK